MIQRDNGDGTYSSFDDVTPLAPMIEPHHIAAFDQLTTALDPPIIKSVMSAVVALRKGLAVEDVFVLVMNAISSWTKDPTILAATTALAITRWAQADSEQEERS